VRGMCLGVDTGLGGALVLVDRDEIARAWDMPITAKTHGKGSEVNAFLVSDLVQEAMAIAGTSGLCAWVEQVAAMPGQGVSSMFSFGRSLGVIEGALAGNGIATYFVRPQRWKKEFGLVGKEKDAARGLVIARWPEHSDLFKRKKDIGRADAALIAEYGATQ